MCRHFPQYQIGTEKTGYVAVCPRHFHGVMTKIAVIGQETPVTMMAPAQLKDAFPSVKKKPTPAPPKEPSLTQETPPTKKNLLTPWTRDGEVLRARGRNHSYSVFQAAGEWYLHVVGPAGTRDFIYPGQKKAKDYAEQYERRMLTHS